MRIGVDLGGTKIEGIALAADGRERWRRRVAAPRGSYDDSVRAIAERIPGARVEVLSRCGHWTVYEKPEECGDLLQRFLSQRIP